MNKRHYEHTLPNIRGSLSNTYISSSSVAFYISNYNSFEITKQIEPNVVSLSVYFMSESLVCYVAKFVFIMKKSAYENKIFR